MTSDCFFGFSIDAVARQADVARMTVYHQFGSKLGCGMLWRPEPPDRRKSTYHHPCMFPPQLWNHGNCVRHWEFKHFHVLSGREPFSELHI
jgi:Bacterial regulatory proteins, tetR family